ncbi:MAG: peptidylprolyl isomerase [Sedimentisphaerales bacterium]|nr:peptidylprolyl isomerase [Sedimentisphaerales bacterium]
MRKYIFLTMLVALLINGCEGNKPKYTEEELASIPLAQREGLPEVSGGFVLAVGGETITPDEIITEPLLEHFRPLAQKTSPEQFKKQVRPEIEQLLTTRISNILLYQQARRKAGSGIDLEDALEKATESETRRFIADFNGDYARAEETLKKMGMDWRSFKDYQKKMILSQDYVRQQLPENKPVTYNELVSCYDEMKEEFFAAPATIIFRLIDIQFPKIEMTDPNIGRPEQARKLANELMERLRKGEDFGELAKKYSHDHMALFGGLWKPLQPSSLASPYDVIAAETDKMEAGQIAGPIEAGEHIFIIKLEEKKPKSYEPLEKVQREVEAKINFDRRKKAADELSANLMQQTALTEKDRFLDFCLEKIYRLSRQQGK